MEEILTAEQVAHVLQVHPFTVLKFIKQGKLKASKLGRVYRIRRSDVDRFLDNQIEQPESDASSSTKPQVKKKRSMKVPKVPDGTPEKKVTDGEQKSEQTEEKELAMKISVQTKEEQKPEQRENGNEVDHYVLELKKLTHDL